MLTARADVGGLPDRLSWGRRLHRQTLLAANWWRERAVLRRTQGEVQTPGLIRSGELEIDLSGHRDLRGESQKLTRIEFNLLSALAQYPGQTCRGPAIDRLHGVAGSGFDRASMPISKSVRKIEDDRPTRAMCSPSIIGYQFSERVAYEWAGTVGAPHREREEYAWPGMG